MVPIIDFVDFANAKSYKSNIGSGFSYGKSQINDVYNYIQDQENHHKKRTFREEYLDLLEKFEIKFDERYLFDFID